MISRAKDFTNKNGFKILQKDSHNILKEDHQQIDEQPENIYELTQNSQDEQTPQQQNNQNITYKKADHSNINQIISQKYENIHQLISNDKLQNSQISDNDKKEIQQQLYNQYLESLNQQSSNFQSYNNQKNNQQNQDDSDEMDEQPKFNLQYEDFEDIVQKQNKFNQTPQQNTNYAQVEFSHIPTIEDNKNFQIKQEIPVGQKNTTAVSFIKERDRIMQSSYRYQMQKIKLMDPDDIANQYQQMRNTLNDQISSQSKNFCNFESYLGQKTMKSNKGRSFPLGRNQIKFGQFNPVNQHPGVGDYNSQIMQNNQFSYTFGKKTPNPIYNKQIMSNPGVGKYQLPGQIHKKGFYKISGHKNSGASVFKPPTEARFKPEKGIKPGPGWYNYEQLNKSQKYRESKLKSAQGGRWGKSERFKEQPLYRTSTPGPGAYLASYQEEKEIEKIRQEKIQKQLDKEFRQSQSKFWQYKQSLELQSTSNLYKQFSVAQSQKKFENSLNCSSTNFQSFNGTNKNQNLSTKFNKRYKNNEIDNGLAATSYFNNYFVQDQTQQTQLQKHTQSEKQIQIISQPQQQAFIQQEQQQQLQNSDFSNKSNIQQLQVLQPSNKNNLLQQSKNIQVKSSKKFNNTANNLNVPKSNNYLNNKKLKTSYSQQLLNTQILKQQITFKMDQ
ncbi:hypothetical protein PPERSA_10795 [Pseudocohnilembus persalinus]|uniref:Uncharacterized protein n=1 Tax=Pseudocohnilembus persalinus TaxID=266149 RepID=A0A0V0QDP0_PSEPJ|nr:hypothetical protein PPERSA_10795 [Pseudocohnilembus persalinus]|eukprot:KRX00296.1 hypothetical protein PPERSA_10795 [Pseudocohnilembus persalinus]